MYLKNISKSTPLKLLNFLLLVIPALIIGFLILKYSVNVPFVDQWVFASIIRNYFQGNLSFADLISQHNESKFLFPRLIFIGLAHLTRWDVRYEMLIIFLVACIIAFNIYKFNRLTLSENQTKAGSVIFIISNLLIFSPIQYENWLWGIQLIVFMPIACITTCLVVAYSRLRMVYKCLICIILSTISTFSYANGLLCWVVVYPVLALSKTGKWKDVIRPKGLFLAWLVGFATNLVIYFYNYRTPLNTTPNYSAAILHPERAIQYFLIFLGAPLGYGTFQVSHDFQQIINSSTVIGTILIVLFISSWIYCLKRLSDSLLVYRMIGWLMIGSYTVISGLVVAVGRVAWGVEQALAPRYTTFSLYLIVAVIHLVTIIIYDVIAQGYLTRYKKFIFTSSLFGLAIIISLHWLTFIHGYYHMSVWRAERLQGKACLLFINIVQENECLFKKVNPAQDIAKEIKIPANELNSLRLLKPGLVETNRIKDIEGTSRKSAGAYGYGKFDTVIIEGKDKYVAAGWARLPKRGEPADAVVLTYKDAGGEEIIFAVSDRKIAREDVAKATKKSAYLMSGWQKYFEASKLPKGKVEINAWAFDANRRKAFRINGSHILENQ